MEIIRFICGVILATTVSVVGLGSAPELPASQPAKPLQPPTVASWPIKPLPSTVPATTTSTTSTIPTGLVRSEIPCQQWLPLLIQEGWPQETQVLEKALKIIWRESRCLPDACSQSDSGRVCRDWGLFQINEHSWRSTIISHGLTMVDMWNPQLNIRFAYWLYQTSLERNGEGWQPWVFNKQT